MKKYNPLNEKLTKAMVEELSIDTDDARAMRRALVHCVILLEGAKDPAVRTFVDFLLVEFRPLASEFTDERHPYLTAFDVTRGRLHTGNLAVVLPLERMRALLAAS